MDDEHFYAVTEQYIQSYFMDTFICRILMILNHERSHNDQLREQYVYWCVEKPLDFQTAVMKRLQDIGYLKKENPRASCAGILFPCLFIF